MAIYQVLVVAALYISTAATQATVVPSYGTWIDPQCYANTPAPMIVSFGFQDSTMTIEKCLNAATTSGYKYAGVANGDHCFGGNIIRVPSPLALSACDKPCISNSAQICGGTDRIIIYRNGPVIVPAPYTSISGYNWMGCSVDSTTGQSLRHAVHAAASIGTLDCIQACSSLNYKLAGIKNGYQCFCGNALLNNAAMLTQFGGSCNSGCEGNPYEECGGAHALTVYRHGLDPITTGPGQTVQSYNGWTLSDCYTDSVSSRSLPSLVSFPAGDMTVEKCLDACHTRGFHLAGVEYGQECFCGNAIQSPGTVTATGCDAMQCVGNANQFCGGPARLLVYQHA
ncbi:WSC-domain-containing protein [Collybia nuda]|uniref:WSC-domain-containing protein n=1 Tax=Collybia nuda TaxID=64659 RepID=A0A9P5YIR4_9AGAR|nr:WSC-domain-containing protein [Collybia nuda]